MLLAWFVVCWLQSGVCCPCLLRFVVCLSLVPCRCVLFVMRCMVFVVCCLFFLWLCIAGCCWLLIVVRRVGCSSVVVCCLALCVVRCTLCVNCLLRVGCWALVGFLLRNVCRLFDVRCVVVVVWGLFVFACVPL